MRASPLVLAIAFGLGLGHPVNETAQAASSVDASKSIRYKTFIVTFEEAPLASFRGSDGSKSSLPKMAATSPSATGEAKLNMNSAASRTYRNFLAKTRNARLDLVSKKVGRQLTPTFVYDVVTHGFAATMTDSEAALLRTVPGVKRVQQEVMYRPMTDRGPQWIKADQVWAGGGTPFISGNKGAGIVIGVIDTGINRTHPSFAASGAADATFAESFSITNPKPSFFGHCVANPGKCNNKLIGIWDFVTGASGIVGDAADTDGHGTHTAGTAAGNPVKITLAGGSVPYSPTMSGVAPRANIIAYKACNPDNCPGSLTLASINQAVADGVNVISYSIGGSPNDPYSNYLNGSIDDSEEAFLAARNANVVSSVAAGNDGPAAGTVGSPSNAPWVMSVAATTHDRALVNQLVLTGGNTPLPGNGTLYGAGNNSGTSVLSARAITKDPNFPLCATGSDPDNTGTGISKPAAWVSGFFGNKIVACQRGFYARIAKSKNVSLGSGGGMVLFNQAAEGDSTVADPHVVPTVHLTYADGQAFLNWLNSGTGHTGQMLGSNYIAVPTYGDKLASFSGRGPVIPTGIIKPDIAAPGVNIYAAGIGASCFPATGTDCAASKSGTSMATPHVAGAMALIKAVNPTWTPNQIISALVLTARSTVKVNGVVGTPHDIGAGQTDVSKAVRAGVFLPVTDAQFKASTAASASNLNLPSLGNSSCFQSCVLSRTFTDMAGGSNYTIVSTLPAGVSVTTTANTLSIASGQSQTVGFTFNVSNATNLLGKWIYGSVTLQNNGGDSRPNLTLPVAIYSSPYSNAAAAVSSISQSVTTERGFFDYTFPALAALPDARFIAADLVTPKVVTPSLPQDPTTSDAYDDLTLAGGIYNDTFVIPASPVTGPVQYKVRVKTSSAASQDIDLFVGSDDNGNGLPSESEEVCTSAGPNANEICEFTVTSGNSPLTYWILAQNFKSQTTGSTDLLRVESFQAPIQAGTNGTMTITGPGKTPSGTNVKVRIAWDDPSFISGQTRIGYLLLQATPGSNAIEIPVELTRTGNTSFEPFALANNVARSVTMPPGGYADRLYFDVPPNATSVTFSTTGTGTVKLGAVRETTVSFPEILRAPIQDTFVSNSAGANQTITLSGTNLQAGRWYVKPSNTSGTVTANIAVKAVINTSNIGPTFKMGSYYNPNRSGHGVFIYPGGTDWAVIWYTFLQDSTPTWYYMQGPKPGVDGIWKGTIYRAAWNGTSKSQTVIGEAQITITSANTFNFHFNLDGQTGSEPMSAFLTGCPQFNGGNLDISAHWYNPASSGFGYSIQVNPNAEFAASFIYDGLGVSRFLVAERLGTYANASETLTLEQVNGYCPLCTTGVIKTRTVVGSYTRTYATNDIVSIGTNATFVNTVPGAWNVTSNVDVLTSTQGCTQ